MIQSMTGFGRGETTGGGKKWSAEVKTVNHRFLDMAIKLPRSMAIYDERIRKKIKERITRGRVDVYVNISEEGMETQKVKLDKELVKAYYSALEDISAVVGVKNDIGVMDIAAMPEVLTIEEPEEDLELFWTFIEEALGSALDGVTAMREKEGIELHKDLLEKSTTIGLACAKLKEISPLVVEEYKEKLTKKITDVLVGVDVDTNRILTEVSIMADRMSIDEEVVRIDSHLKQLKKEINTNQPVGRKLDFLIQELNREVNTIGSKSNNYEISNLVVELKTSIEKLREQVQNIE